MFEMMTLLLMPILGIGIGNNQTAKVTPPNKLKIIYVEDIGNDAVAIQTAIDKVGENGVVVLAPGKTYTQKSSLVLSYNGIKIIGNNATLKRGNQETTTLSEPCDSMSTQIHVQTVPRNWKTHDQIQIYSDSTYLTSNEVISCKISSISGNTIKLVGVVGKNAGLRRSSWDVGAVVRKVYNQIVVLENNSCTIEDLIIDGNRSNNSGNYYWGVNSAISNYAALKINRCKFIEIPNETLIGVGFTITNSYAKNLNGSFIHESSDNLITDKSRYFSQISNNLTDSTNLLSSKDVTGHSEGLITFSATAGRQNIHNNYFFNGNNSVLGCISSLNDPGDGTRDFIFTDNFVSGFKSIVYVFYQTNLPNKAGNFTISNNVFRDCGENDFAYVNFHSFDQINITGNHLWGKTNWINIPAIAKGVQSFSTDNIILNTSLEDSVRKVYPSGDLVLNSINYRQQDSTFVLRKMKIRSIGQENYWGLPKVSIMGVSDWKEAEYEMTVIDANSKIITTPYDIEVSDSAKGVILNSPNGTRYRITVDDDGTLKASSIH